MDSNNLLEAISILIVILFLGALVYGCVSYLELKSVINDCNKDLGVGNWTFVHETKWPYDQYTCRSYNQQSFVTSSIQTITYKQCFENGKEISC